MTEFLTLNRSYTFIFSFINSIKSNNSVNNFFIVSTNSLLKKKKFDKNESKPSYKLIHVEQYFGFDLQNNINISEHDFGSYQVWKWHAGNFRPALTTRWTQVYSHILGGGRMEGDKTHASAY